MKHDFGVAFRRVTTFDDDIVYISAAGVWLEARSSIAFSYKYMQFDTVYCIASCDLCTHAVKAIASCALNGRTFEEEVLSCDPRSHVTTAAPESTSPFVNA